MNPIRSPLMYCWKEHGQWHCHEHKKDCRNTHTAFLVGITELPSSERNVISWEERKQREEEALKEYAKVTK